MRGDKTLLDEAFHQRERTPLPYDRAVFIRELQWTGEGGGKKYAADGLLHGCWTEAPPPHEEEGFAPIKNQKQRKE